MNTLRRALALAPLAAGTALLLAPTAFAHVGTDKDEVAAGASTTLTFSINHGCDGSPTNALKFQIPEGINNATAFVHPGWTATYEKADLAQPEQSSHGEEVTDRVSVITFTAGDGAAIPGDQKDTFTLAFTAPEETGQIFFKVIQACESGENDWIDEWDGTGTEPENPAPSLMVVPGDGAAGGDHHAEEGGTETTVAVGEHDDSSSHDDSSNGLAIAGLVVGALGLVTGGVALLRSRKPAAS